MSRGHERERDVRRRLEADGWVCVRAAGSLGPVDVVAIIPGCVRFVEVKSTARGPFHGFPPAERAEMLEVAARAGAEAWLAWWPVERGRAKGSRLRWIEASQWPGRARARAA